MANSLMPPPAAQAPLLDSTPNHVRNRLESGGGEEFEDGALGQTLRRLEGFLWLLGFNQSSVLTASLSWLGFLTIAVAIPFLVLYLDDCSGGCEQYQYRNFELYIVACQASLAAVSLLCVSHNLRKYGIRKFLFVDRQGGNTTGLRDRYLQQIMESVRLLVIWSLPGLILKIAREVSRAVYSPPGQWWQTITVLLVFILTWTYVSTVSLTASAMFHLVCNLQVILFDDYAKLLETESNILIFIEEHMRLRFHLSKISHRFRLFLLMQFLVVTASQIITLFWTTGSNKVLTLVNSGDFAVSTIVQVVGIVFCLHAATKISHRAQSTVSLASRWHALATCSSTTDSSHGRIPSGAGNVDAAAMLNSLHTAYSDSDLESLDYVPVPSNAQLASYMTSYHKRQAFVMYLLTNPGGITVFGWKIDRELLNTIFCIELTLVTFVLGKTLVLGSE